MSNNPEPCWNCGFQKSQSGDDAQHPAFPHHLLTTNDPPSDTEKIKVQDILHGLHTRISNLDASIAAAEDTLLHLRNKRKSTVEDVHRGTAILSIIRRLPEDVLTEVFSHTLPDVSRRRPMERSPWVLDRICSRWRTISIFLPTLWSHIDANLPLPILMAHLQRSKGCGLHICLIYSDTEALRQLVDHCTRWESVDIRMGVDMLPILEAVHGNLPMLRQLKYTDDTGVGFCQAFETAPRLSSVIIHGKASLLRLPWEQLTKLRERIPRIDDLSRLGCARNLVELSLTNSISMQLALARTGGPPESLILEFPCLRLLHVEDGEFLDFLLSPMLEDIYIHKNISPLTSLIDRSSCSLRRIAFLQGEAAEAVPILDHTPNLLEIRFACNASNTESLISHLTIPSQPVSDLPPPCPELISISVCFFVTDCEHLSSLLVQMLESRLHSTACSNLSSCTVLNLCSKTDGFAPQALQRIRSLGSDAKWMSESAKHGLVDWRNEYP
ncbi:hypothetical protein DFH06DRAFT_1105207 [Mycena polygramma]|nr:hypothetical protein DFH06DRAFT_1105207 [Mycena polygramma]